MLSALRTPGCNLPLRDLQALAQREVPALQQKVADQEATEAAAAERLDVAHAEAAEAQHALQVCSPCCAALPVHSLSWQMQMYSRLLLVVLIVTW